MPEQHIFDMNEYCRLLDFVLMSAVDPSFKYVRLQEILLLGFDLSLTFMFFHFV
jgi:hypothetical protein